MATYTDVNGVQFTDEDIERWAAEVESEEGPPLTFVEAPRKGRPRSVGEEADVMSFRIDLPRRQKLQNIAKTKGVSASDVVRELIDAA